MSSLVCNLLSAYDDDSHRYVRDKYVTECGYNLLSAYDDDNHRYVRHNTLSLYLATPLSISFHLTYFSFIYY